MFSRIGAFFHRPKKELHTFDTQNNTEHNFVESVPVEVVDPRFKILNYGKINMLQPINKEVFSLLTENDIANMLSKWRDDLRTSISGQQIRKLFLVIQELKDLSPDVVGSHLPSGVRRISCSIGSKLVTDIKGKDDAGLDLIFTRIDDKHNYRWQLDGIYNDKSVLRLSVLDDTCYEWDFQDTYLYVDNVIPGKWLNSLSELCFDWPISIGTLIKKEYARKIQITESQAITQTLSYFETVSTKFKDFPDAELSSTHDNSKKIKIVNDYMCDYFKQQPPKLEKLYDILKDPLSIDIKNQLLELLNIESFETSEDSVSFKLRDSDDISCKLEQLSFEFITEYAFKMCTPLTNTGELSLRANECGQVLVNITGGSAIDVILDLLETRLPKACELKNNYDNTGSLIDSRALATQCYELD